MGIDNLKVLVADVAQVMGSVVKAITSKSIFGLIGLLPAILSLRSVDFAASLAELKDLDGQERADIEAAFMASFDPGDAALKEKLGQIVGLVDDSVSIVAEAIALGTSAVAVVNRFRALVGV